MSKYPIEDQFPLLANTDSTNRCVLALPRLNALGEVYIKEALSTWTQLMPISVGSAKNSRIIICTQAQVLKKFIQDKILSQDDSSIPADGDPSLVPSNDTVADESSKPALSNECEADPAIIAAEASTTCNSDAKDVHVVKSKSTICSGAKRPDLPRYVSPAARRQKHTQNSNCDSREACTIVTEVPDYKTPAESKRKLSFNLVQPPDDEVWKQLDDNQLEEIYILLGNVEVTKPNEDDCPSRMTKELKEDALSHIVELYNMHKEIKTKDVVALFDKFNGVQSHIKWVDDERALVIFASPDLAKDALQVFHPVIQSRFVEFGSRESKLRILSCTSSSHVLPLKERPKTVTFMARRLISSQLGPEFKNASPKVLQKESSIIRAAIAEKQQNGTKRAARGES